MCLSTPESADHFSVAHIHQFDVTVMPSPPTAASRSASPLSALQKSGAP
ncbi:hypothetical protein OH492_11910 [Vibrio chagasii]|nr:hypothetical protein [Vibrio chagasii]